LVKPSLCFLQAGVTQAVEDYGQGMGRIRGRSLVDLDKFKVPAEEQAELRAIVNSTRPDVVFDSALAQGAA
jgi:hypothetical protein